MAYRTSYNSKFGELGAHVAQKWPEGKIISEKGKKIDTLGLALSGGGYRSAIFNYGILKGLTAIGVIPKIDYLSVVSGGSWIGTSFATSNSLEHFFDDLPEKPNMIEEGFESFLANPIHTGQELFLARKNANYVSNTYGRLLARTFLREHGPDGRWRPLADPTMIKDKDRPFLIINGTVGFRPREKFRVDQECFEMTRLYCGSRTLGYMPSKDLRATDKLIRVRDAIAMSGAAVAAHLPGLGSEVIGVGLSREVLNYTLDHVPTKNRVTDADEFDVADGGHYNNLGVETLVNRGCGYLIIVDAEHDPENHNAEDAGQKYEGLRTLLKRHHIKMPFGQNANKVVAQLNKKDKLVHEFRGDSRIPDILFIKLKSWNVFDKIAAKEPYNQPSFFNQLFKQGKFGFNPQFSTAKLDYDFAEHRNLSKLGELVIKKHKRVITQFVKRSR